MTIIDHVVVSSDVEQEAFVCDLTQCKGACCVAGDLGAPLTEDELDKIDEVIEIVKPYLSAQAIEVLENEGGYIYDEEGDFSTTTIKGKECAFVYYDAQGIVKCSIEKAWKDGKTDFRKPISCHLYPIRVQHLEQFEALNYDRWSICSAACTLGEKLKIKVYQFLKEPLIRKYGEAWYHRLDQAIKNKEKS